MDFYMEAQKELARQKRREKEYGRGASDIGKFVDPNKAEIKDVIETQYYVPRKVDIERLLAIADLANSNEQNEQIKILDLGGGKGFLAKLLADRMNEKKENGLVIDLDIDQEKIREAKDFYKNTKGLQFVASDTEKEAGNIFNTEFDLAIVSWAHSKDDLRTGGAYSENVRKLKPRFFVNIGEERGDFTGRFEPAAEYIKIGEWFGPISKEMPAGLMHGDYDEKEEKFLNKNGSNLFEIYARKDVAPGSTDKLKEQFKKIKINKKYKWEDKLGKIYPKISSVNFDKKTFWRKEEEQENDIINKFGRRVETSRIGDKIIDVGVLAKFAENLPVETAPTKTFENAVGENQHYWIAEDGQHIGPFEILKNWEFAQKNPLWTEHVNSIKNANLDNPIWISPDGIVFDGMHRLTRAFLDGVKEIKVRRFKELPKEAIIE